MPRSARSSLLPLWIRVFSWLFLVIGVPGTLTALLGFIFNFTFPIFLFGLRSQGPLRAPVTIVLAAAFALVAYAAFALLWGRKDGRQAGLAAGYVGLGICVAVAGASFSEGRIYIPLEPLFQIPFLWKMHALKGRWENTPNPASD